MGRVVSPTPTPLSSGRVVPALVASYDMHGRAVGLFYTQPTGRHWYDPTPKKKKKKKSRRKRDSNPGSSALEADALPLGQRGGVCVEDRRKLRQYAGCLRVLMSFDVYPPPLHFLTTICPIIIISPLILSLSSSPILLYRH